MINTFVASHSKMITLNLCEKLRKRGSNHFMRVIKTLMASLGRLTHFVHLPRNIQAVRPREIRQKPELWNGNPWFGL